MGRLIVADGCTNTAIDKLYITDGWKIGFIIGQHTPQKDIAVHLIETPRDEVEDRTGDVKNIIDVSEIDVKCYALQILRMLPGGIDIIGMFFYASSQMLQISQAKIKQLLLTSNKAIQKFRDIDSPSNLTYEKHVIQICSLTRTFSCKSYDMNDSKSGPKPADWKTSHTPENWIEISSSLLLDLKFYIPTDLKANIYKQFLTGLKPFCNNILEAECVIDDKILVDDSAPLVESAKPATSKKGKRNNLETKEKIQKSLDILFPFVSFSQSQNSCKLDCSASIHMYGVISSKAFLHFKASISEVKAAVKEDLIRSILTRAKLLSEEIEQSDECQNRKIYEMPKRCYATLNDLLSMQFCDYLFPDESVLDSCDRFNELLNIQLNTDHFNDSLEEYTNQNELCETIESSKNTDCIVLTKSKQSDKIKYLSSSLSIVTSGVVALIALGLSYMYLE